MVLGAQQDPVVVVGCDGSWESMDAVDIAVDEARWRELPLVVLTIEDGPGRDVRHLGDWSRASAQGADEAAATVQRALARIGDKVPVVTTVVAPNVEGAQLEALGTRAALLVVGRHGARGLGAFASGSTSEQLVRRLGCPVLVAARHPTSQGGDPTVARHPAVVVGVDDEPGAGMVLSFAVEVAQLRGWALTVVHAAPRTDTELHVLASRVWERHSELLLARRSPDHSLARVVVDVDEPIAALLAHAGPRDLLVVGTEGEGRLAGLVGGSVARGVLDQMPCDVLVVPPDAVRARRERIAAGAAERIAAGAAERVAVGAAPHLLVVES